MAKKAARRGMDVVFGEECKQRRASGPDGRSEGMTSSSIGIRSAIDSQSHVRSFRCLRSRSLDWNSTCSLSFSSVFRWVFSSMLRLRLEILIRTMSFQLHLSPSTRS